MIHSNIISVYNSLDNAEKRFMRKYFSLEFVNKNDPVFKLFLFIDSRKSITALTVNKQRAFKYLFKNKPYRDLKMRHSMWQTAAAMEEAMQYYCLSKKRNA